MCIICLRFAVNYFEWMCCAAVAAKPDSVALRADVRAAQICSPAVTRDQKLPLTVQTCHPSIAALLSSTLLVNVRSDIEGASRVQLGSP